MSVHLISIATISLVEINRPLQERTLPTAGGGLQSRCCRRTGEDSQWVKKISALTGKESRAFIVRRNVLGCLSRDGGARGEVRRAMSREERME